MKLLVSFFEFKLEILAESSGLFKFAILGLDFHFDRRVSYSGLFLDEEAIIIPREIFRKFVFQIDLSLSSDKDMQDESEDGLSEFF